MNCLSLGNFLVPMAWSDQAKSDQGSKEGSNLQPLLKPGSGQEKPMSIEQNIRFKLDSTKIIYCLYFSYGYYYC